MLPQRGPGPEAPLPQTLFLPERNYVTFDYFLSTVRLPSVYNIVHSTQPVEFFVMFYAILHRSHPLISMQNLVEIFPGEPFRLV